ncbi:YgiW/YdeI family stress tolerance OB fold protein [Alloalcanivorax mobilis]|uniref:YgiW/YdeI family stress tolerance OB fold protein n=1 Tax=Alloalcanivorax mobilis TaxID=2019569 RepID=UPI000B5B0E97|nr:NirD/YgiW/YdeI family stress tolerance protein [Alloalcanivorax mobilis]ASK36201.1 DNA-binding protein [Alcanivorax sp. N3-2A]
MKKILLAAMIAAGSISVAHAGNVNDAIVADSAAIQQGIDEGQMVKLQGEIIQSLGDERYTLKDTNGQIEVEIDNDLTGDRPLQPGTNVVVIGEVDHDDGRTLVDVDKVLSMQGASTAETSAPTGSTTQ